MRWNSFPSLSVKLTLLVSFTTSSSSSNPLPPPGLTKATPSDLLSLLGTKQQSSRIHPRISRSLKSCLKFIVPITPAPELKCRHFIKKNRVDGKNELVWWPPEPVLDLARLAFDSGGDPGSIQRLLDPTMLVVMVTAQINFLLDKEESLSLVFPVPDVEGSEENHCELTRTPYVRRFINEDFNSYLEFLFKLIVERGPAVGLNVSLNRYDFFHGHVFLAWDTGRLGILFHAKEYPSYAKEVFPYNMGYCQIGSNVEYDDSMNLRKILWLAPIPSSSSKALEAPGVLVVLDARPGGIIYTDLVPDYVNYARTLYEDDFGDVVVDVNYLNVGNAASDYQIHLLTIAPRLATPSSTPSRCDILYVENPKQNHSWTCWLTMRLSVKQHICLSMRL